jgi:hypothetical protein
MRYGVRSYGQGDPLFTKSAAIGIQGPILAFHVFQGLPYVPRNSTGLATENRARLGRLARDKVQRLLASSPRSSGSVQGRLSLAAQHVGDLPLFTVASTCRVFGVARIRLPDFSRPPGSVMATSAKCLWTSRPMLRMPT